MSYDEIEKCMEVLDPDESQIDQRLLQLMTRESYTESHLTNVTLLLKYKLLINKKEDDDCDNEKELEFIVKLIPLITADNSILVCKIINSILNLDRTSLVNKAEYMLQQLLPELFTDSEKNTDGQEMTKEILHLKICDSILDAVSANGMTVSLAFTELPIDKILLGRNEHLKKHFLVYTVPRINSVVIGYSVLDKIGEMLKGFQNEQMYEALKILGCLANFYLPDPKLKITSSKPWSHISENAFLRIVKYGMSSTSLIHRQTALYLLKRCVELNTALGQYDEKYKNSWENYFVLMESLEEKQCNIVLPSLQLFESLKTEIDKEWLESAYTIGIKHDNTQVKRKCLEHRLTASIDTNEQAKQLFEALNDLKLYYNLSEAENIISKLKTVLGNENNFIRYADIIVSMQWSPVPLYYVIKALKSDKMPSDFVVANKETLIQSILKIMGLECNDKAIKQFVQLQMMKLTVNNCEQFHWKCVFEILSTTKLYLVEEKDYLKILPGLKNLRVQEEERTNFLQFVTSSHVYIHPTLAYINLQNQLDTFSDFIKCKINNIKDINSRPYSNKEESFKDLLYLAHLFNPLLYDLVNSIMSLLNKEISTFIKYISLMLADDRFIVKENNPETLKQLHTFILFYDLNGEKDVLETFEQIYKAALYVSTDNECNDLSKRVLSLSLLRSIYELNEEFQLRFRQEKVFEKLSALKLTDAKKEWDGKLKDAFYETVTELVYRIFENDSNSSVQGIVDYVQFYMECGTGASLTWIIALVKEALSNKTLENFKEAKFDIRHFIDRSWREIEESKSPKLHHFGMGEFTSLLLQEKIIENSEYNNVVLYYFNRIIERAHTHSNFESMFNFACSLDNRQYKLSNGLLIHLLQESLFFSPVIKKEVRVLNNIMEDICKSNHLNSGELGGYSLQSVQYIIVRIVHECTDTEVRKVLLEGITKKIDDAFKNRDRYHADSQLHKTVLIGIQHMLFMALIETKLIDPNIVLWCIKLLSRLPHQPSVRTCLEWLVAFYMCANNVPLNGETVEELNLKSAPPTSQLLILFYVMKHRIFCEEYKTEEYDYVMRYLMAQTMGPLFNVRIHAQYLANKLYGFAVVEPDVHKYAVNIIQETLQASSGEKTYKKLKSDIFANQFDVVCFLTPYFIYEYLPKYYKVGGMFLDGSSKSIHLPSLSEIKKSFEETGSVSGVLKTWTLYSQTKEEIDALKIETDDADDGAVVEEAAGDIQKKYIPWKNMTDLGFGDGMVKSESSSDLIVVASLIDKLPNLGGLARTCEVFGARSCVVASLVRLRDPQFRGLSVSAERWVDIQEVHPGPKLKEYLLTKKSEGYALVAAEQTSGSVPLQTFKFPRKTVLLMGHEKYGVPCDLIPVMDTCVEVPQSGFVRSLNVHVTAAIFIWEYNRQNML